MSIQIAANANGALTLENIFADITTPITFMLWAKVVAWPASVSHADIGLMRIRNDDASNFGEVYQACGAANAGPYGQIYSGAATYFGAQRAKTESQNIWVPIAVTFASATSRTLRWYQNGALQTATNATNRPITSLDDLVLFSGAYTVSARRYAYLAVLPQSISDSQFDEYRLTGSVAGATPLERWDAVNDWGAGNIGSTGSGAHAITPPGTWTYSSDNPVLESVPGVTSVNSGNGVQAGGSITAVLQNFLAAPTGGNLGGKALTGFGGTSASSNSVMPAYADGEAYPDPNADHTLQLTAPGPQSASITVPLLPPEGYDVVEFAALVTDDDRYLAAHLPIAAGQKFVDPAEGGGFEVYPDGRVRASALGVRSCWRWNDQTAVMHQVFITADQAGVLSSRMFIVPDLMTGEFIAADFFTAQFY